MRIVYGISASMAEEPQYQCSDHGVFRSSSVNDGIVRKIIRTLDGCSISCIIYRQGAIYIVIRLQ